MSDDSKPGNWEYCVLELVRGPRSHSGAFEGQVDNFYPLLEKIRAIRECRRGNMSADEALEMAADDLRKLSKPLADWLNEMADDGFELVSLVNSESDGYEITAVFKRPANLNPVRQFVAASRYLKKVKEKK